MFQTIFLQAAQQGGWSTLLLFGGMFVIMYFFMIRPTMQRQKKEKLFQSDIKKGDNVVTTSGIHGRIGEMYDDHIILETGAGKIKMERTSISKELTVARYKTAVEEKA